MELVYEVHGAVRGSNVKFSHLCYDDTNLEYCDTVHNSDNMFGCVSVKKGEYMIFNKKYNKEEYKDLKTKIINHMKNTGEYGEFFPPQMSPVSFNETQGMIYMPMSKDEILAKGWKWEDNLPGTFGKETIEPNEIPDDIKDVKNEILKAVLKCEACTKNYNIVEPELMLYRRLNIPVVRQCPDCRYKARIAIRNPRKLYHRQCACLSAGVLTKADAYKNTTSHFHGDNKCPNEFETSFAPERPETVYCEQCYLSEIA